MNDTITDNQLRELFAKHCECRPLDLTRTEGDHAAIHDCDTGILHDIQIALGIIRFDDIGRIQAMRDARARCAEVLHDALENEIDALGNEIDALGVAALAIVQDIIKDLRGRSGLRGMWDDVDEDVRAEIVIAWRLIAEARLRAIGGQP